MKRYYLAIDIGASSGRHILGSVEDGKYVLEEIYRFPNGAEKRGAHLCWDLEALFGHVVEGLRRCRDAGKIPESVGIDTWGVDFVLLDKDGCVIGDTVAYRDDRTNGMDQAASELIPDGEFYSRVGIQKIPINTVYQLLALKREHPEDLEKAKTLLMIPDYLNYRLTGNLRAEYTNATTTSLVNAKAKDWDRDVIARLGLPGEIFLPLSLPGTEVGSLHEEIAEAVGFRTKVVLPATHDTGSAFLAVPARDDDAVYISSGTWSLMGVENPAPITGEESRIRNFTNEGGYGYRYRYLKNIMGLWIIQSIRHELNDAYSFAQLEALAREASDFPSAVSANDARFLAPQSMTEEIKAACRESGQPVPETVGQLIRCAYRSLALCYRDTVRELREITGKKYTSVNVVGGGSKDGYLNELTAGQTGLPVFAGPSEGTALGNLMLQMITAGEFPDLESARGAIRSSFSIKEYRP